MARKKEGKRESIKKTGKKPQPITTAWIQSPSPSAAGVHASRVFFCKMKHTDPRGCGPSTPFWWGEVVSPKRTDRCAKRWALQCNVCHWPFCGAATMVFNQGTREFPLLLKRPLFIAKPFCQAGSSPPELGRFKAKVQVCHASFWDKSHLALTPLED